MLNKLLLDSNTAMPLFKESIDCYVSDMNAIEEKGVNFFYREFPDDAKDSGWRFFSGKEVDIYFEKIEPENIYKLNAVANRSYDIIPFLSSPYHTAYKRNKDTKKFEKLDDFDFKDEM